MEIMDAEEGQWEKIRQIYFEAFPKSERKPFFTIRRSVKRGKALMLTALEEDTLLGFVVAVPYHNTVMIDYLAVSGKVRSQGTGSRIIREVCRKFPDKRIVLLIERPDETAQNKEQRISRRKFYLKNGFTSSGIFITGYSGDMEILNFGGVVSWQEYRELQRYALGKLMFYLSGIRPAV